MITPQESRLLESLMRDMVADLRALLPKDSDADDCEDCPECGGTGFECDDENRSTGRGTFCPACLGLGTVEGGAA